MKKRLLQRHTRFLQTSLFVAFFLLSAQTVYAARLLLEIFPTMIKPGQETSVGVWANTEGESINALAGEVFFPTDHLGMLSISDGGSLVSVWLEPPHIVEKGHIRFSGIAPGGYRGERGLLFTITFVGKREGVGMIKLNGEEALKNDGNATQVAITGDSRSVSVSTLAPASQVVQAKDPEAPEPFSAQVSASSDAFEGKRVLIFATQDKGSGLSHYEICEGIFAICKQERSPYVLTHQIFGTFVTIKAYDNSGNVRIEKLSTFSALATYSLYGILGILVVILVGLRALHRRKHS